jgi:hypothetical protein
MARRRACHPLLAARADAANKIGQNRRGIESPMLPLGYRSVEYRFQYVSSFGIYPERDETGLSGHILL